jgi:hypothetical protein
MSTHPTVFELDVFVRRGATSADFEHHVSGCGHCAQRLSSMARRAAPASLVMDEPEGRRLQVAAVALAACLAVLLVRTVSLAPTSNEFVAPEGVHGVASAPIVMIVGDTGPTDSGVR